jgi:hypothetical protein
MVQSPLGVTALAAHGAIVQLCALDLTPLELLEQVAHRVRTVVPYAAAGWMPADPATLLWTGTFAEDVPAHLHRQLIDNELMAADFAKFSEIARLRRPVMRLHQRMRSRSASHRAWWCLVMTTRSKR